MFLFINTSFLAKPTECPQSCPFFYQPVCGSNGRTYSSECILKANVCENEAKDLTVAYKGVCKGL